MGGRHSRRLDWELDLLNEKRAVTGATGTRSVKF